ncbi:MAG TPA: malectin domain-containing carbohydrate-binding protein [Candidatus Acidoferrum sp.]|nr:malectin domain-containing carbohydrate-binding protein [Candidatus Acidoferrum sp.]
MRLVFFVALLLAGGGSSTNAPAATNLPAYYAHPTGQDAYGVIAPWYQGLNGQLDERLTIAINVYKRYPWVDRPKAVMAAPDFVYNSHWSIKPDGTILIPPTTDWMCGDLCARAWSIVKGLTAYYQYSGDPIAFIYIPLAVDYILDFGLTDEKADWPLFPISTPTRGKAYGKCDPSGRSQLDLCAITGVEVLRAHKLTGNPRYLQMAEHWGDVFAAKCQFRDPELSPWNRYVDPSVVGWSDVLTGTTSLIADFLDELIRMGYSGKDGALVKARDAGRRFLNEKMFPAWFVNDTWARTYWDWDNPMMCGMVSMCADHFMKYPGAYPNWRADLRNMLSLTWNRNGADPASRGDVYSGAWAFPESSVCCGTSLSYNQYTAGPTLIRYGVLANSEWAREIGRRMMLMATYDSLPNGVVKDGLLGDQVATGEWSNLAHPWPLCQVLEAIAWLPHQFGPNRENHIVRSTSVVKDVLYEKGRLTYETFDAPMDAQDVLRLAFQPTLIQADGRRLKESTASNANSYSVEPLPNGDCIVIIRHAGAKRLVVEGPDPQQVADDPAFSSAGAWTAVKDRADLGGGFKAAGEAGAAMTFKFNGNQVRLMGMVGPDGGWADAFVDGAKEPTIVECWNPSVRHRQPIFLKKGLTNGDHELKIVVRGEKNPLASGTLVRVDSAQYSAATGDAGFGSGGGPKEPQRLLFGYTGRHDYVDSHGNAWHPGTEFVTRLGFGVDTVARCWWLARRSMYIGGTADPELYRYGVHAPEFWVNLTVAPGKYLVRLHWADTPETPWVEREGKWEPVSRPTTVAINGITVVQDLNVRNEVGTFKAYVREFPGIRPQNGSIELRFKSTSGHEAMIQAVELIPDPKVD